MSYGAYVQFKKEELILRDYLAADRTALANERTLMSFIRTAVALAAAGGSLIHFFDSLITTIGGVLIILLATVTFGWGLQRFAHFQRHLKSLRLANWHEQIQWVKPGEGI